MWNAAYARLAVGDVDAAATLFTEEIDLAVAGGYGIGEMVGCNVMGEIWEARGEFDTAAPSGSGHYTSGVRSVRAQPRP